MGDLQTTLGNPGARAFDSASNYRVYLRPQERCRTRHPCCLKSNMQVWKRSTDHHTHACILLFIKEGVERRSMTLRAAHSPVPITGPHSAYAFIIARKIQVTNCDAARGSLNRHHHARLLRQPLPRVAIPQAGKPVHLRTTQSACARMYDIHAKHKKEPSKSHCLFSKSTDGNMQNTEAKTKHVEGHMFRFSHTRSSI